MYDGLAMIQPATSQELVLGSLAQKTSTGGRLTGAEVLMGMSAATSQSGTRFGPGPADMPTPQQFMPESLKGAIASARI